MNDDEFRDPDLTARLGRLAGPMPDVTPALNRVQHRAVQVRRRRAAAWSAVGISALVVGMFAIRPGSAPDVVQVGGEAEGTSISTSVDGSTPGEISSSSVGQTSIPGADTLPGDPSSTIAGSPATVAGAAPTVAGGGAAPTNAGDSATSVAGSASPVTTKAPSSTTRPPSATTRAPSTTAPPVTTGAPPSSSLPTSSTGAPIVDITKSQNSIGGTITVRLSNGALSLVSSSAAGGFDKEIESNGPTEIEVQFESSTHKSKITARISGGSIAFEVEEDDKSEDSSDTTSADESEDSVGQSESDD